MQSVSKITIKHKRSEKMGADLIGYIVVGPKDLDKSPEKKQALLAQAEKDKKLIDEISALLTEKGLDDADYEDQIAALSDEQRTYVEKINEYRESEGWFREEEDVNTLLDWAEESFTPEATEGIIDDLFALWEGGARDAMSRELPGDPDRCILACGELSWGDEPSGFGYQTLKKAERAGILDTYDIH
jgi:hypothetical protein